MANSYKHHGRLFPPGKKDNYQLKGEHLPKPSPSQNILGVRGARRSQEDDDLAKLAEAVSSEESKRMV